MCKFLIKLSVMPWHSVGICPSHWFNTSFNPKTTKGHSPLSTPLFMLAWPILDFICYSVHFCTLYSTPRRARGIHFLLYDFHITAQFTTICHSKLVFCFVLFATDLCFDGMCAHRYHLPSGIILGARKPTPSCHRTSSVSEYRVK